MSAASLLERRGREDVPVLGRPQDVTEDAAAQLKPAGPE